MTDVDGKVLNMSVDSEDQVTVEGANIMGFLGTKGGGGRIYIVGNMPLATDVGVGDAYGYDDGYDEYGYDPQSDFTVSTTALVTSATLIGLSQLGVGMGQLLHAISGWGS